MHAYDWQYLGFALQILERQQEIVGSIGSLDETKNTCTEWDNWESANPTVYNPLVDQDDSGIWGSDRSLFFVDQNRTFLPSCFLHLFYIINDS